MRIGIAEIYQAALTAGFTPDQATTWTAIALAESGGETGALNNAGEHSVGLWQINVGVHTNTWGDLNDPLANARAAYEISHQGTDMRPWTTTHVSHLGTATDYRTHLAEVSAITGYAGDDRGVEGYGTTLPEPLPPSPPAAATLAAGTESAGMSTVDLASDPGSKLDSDQDGLTDAFERMVGSRIDLVDSDSDGLSDAFETVVSRTDPILADTDTDTLSDSDEVALGTSGSTWDTDQDGASDGAEVQYQKDPLVAEGGVTVPVGDTATLARTTTEEAAPDTVLDPTGTTEASAAVEEFVEEALEQKGDDYVWGAMPDADDADPEGFDCSALTQWAASQVGVTIPRTSYDQYLELKEGKQLLDVDEALQTPGALLFYFSSEPTPGGGRPGSAHVAISLGDGRTIEARGSDYGVMVVGAEENEGRFNRAGVIPEMEGADPSDLEAMAGDALDAKSVASAAFDPDSDDDGLSDEFEKLMRLDPRSADSDGDGTSDAAEVLGDESSTLTRSEVTAALAEQGLESAGDEDADGLSNRYEIKHRLDAHNADSDGDALSDSTEVAYGTDARLMDSDFDGVTDPTELELGTDPLKAGDLDAGWGAWLDTKEPDPSVGEPISAGDDDGDIG